MLRNLYIVKSLLVFTVVSFTLPSYNQIWHPFIRKPDNLPMNHVIAAPEFLRQQCGADPLRWLNTRGIAFVP
jgi:hypothetical protein